MSPQLRQINDVYYEVHYGHKNHCWNSEHQPCAFITEPNLCKQANCIDDNLVFIKTTLHNETESPLH